MATATEEGAFGEPFERVDFWMQDVNGGRLAARVGYIRRARACVLDESQVEVDGTLWTCPPLCCI